VSFKSGSGERAESLGVRRSVELPEADIEAAGDLAPASESASVEENDQAASAEEKAGDSPTRPEETVPSAKEEKEQDAAPARDVAMATQPDTAVGVDDGPPPDRPKKPVLAAVAIGGAVLLAIPILLIGTGSHDGKKHRTAAVADRVLPGDGQPPPPPGAFVSSSPSVTPSPSASASPKAKGKAKPAKHDAVKHAAAVSAKAGFRGTVNVLLKNAATGMCADVPGYGAGSADGPVNQFHCALGDSDNQVWALGVMQGLKGPGGTALFEIRNTKDNYCMDLPYYGAQKAGTKVSEYYCRPTKGDNQLWYRAHTHGSLYRIRNDASHGLCLGVTGRSHAGADNQLEIHKCGSGDEWSWPSGT
jgi:hypothetical protein